MKAARRWWSSGYPLAVASSLAVSSIAHADTAAAEALFQQGKQLMADKQFERACPKLAESMRLDPAGGTLLLLSVCHESAGKTASAWGELNDSIAMAKRDARPDREKVARDRLAALEPRLSKLALHVTTPYDGLDLKVDAVSLGRAVWDTPVPMDPGPHELLATAPGHKTWRATITIRAEEALQSVNVPALETETTTTEAPPPAEASGTGRRTAAWVLGGVGIAAIGTGAFFGLRAASKHSTVTSECPGNICPTQAGKDANDDAKTAARVADVAFAIGVASLGVGTYLFFTSSPSSATAKSTVVVPVMDAHFAGLGAVGSF